jgi:hypothetical protein
VIGSDCHRAISSLHILPCLLKKRFSASTLEVILHSVLLRFFLTRNLETHSFLIFVNSGFMKQFLSIYFKLVNYMDF